MNKKDPTFNQFAAKCEAHLSTHGITDFFLVVYFTSVALTFLWGFHTEFVKPQNGPFRWYIGLARSAGYSLNLNTALVLLLASRLFLTALRDSALADALPLDKAFPELHIVVAYTIILSVVVHVPFHFVWIIGWDKWAPGLWNVNMTVITGCLLLLVFLILVLFALPAVRTKYFRLFYMVHLIGATLFFALLIFHGMYEAKPETYKWVVAPLLIYLVDRVLRVFSVSEHRVQLSASNSSFKDDNILQLAIPKPFSFRPGQYAEIKVPSINREWHPFTIASAEYEDNMSFYIKLLGDWTKALHDKFQGRMSGAITTPLELFVRGPFGAPAQQVDKYSRVFLISGGIGATPFMSICKQLNHQHKEQGARIHYTHRPRPDESTLDDAAEQRIRDAVKNIYNIDIDVLDLGCDNWSEMAAEREREDVAKHEMEYVAEMLRVASSTANLDLYVNNNCNNIKSDNPQNEMSGKVIVEHSDGPTPTQSHARDSIDVAKHGSGEHMGRTSLSSDNSSTGAPTVHAMDSALTVKFKALRTKLRRPEILSEEEREGRRREAKLGDLRSTLLSILHSSRVTLILAVLCVLRAAVTICGSIFDSGFVLLSTPLSTGRWVALAYAILSCPLAILTMLTVLLEVSLHYSASFSSTRRVFEVLVFGPLALVQTALEFRRWATNDPGGPVSIFIQYILVQSVTFVLIVGRLYRAVGRYGLLDDRHVLVHNKSPNHIPDADFVWTVSDSADDRWLRRELVPVALGGAVTVHRYVTRGGTRQSVDGSDEGQGEEVHGIEEVQDMEEGRRVSIALNEATKEGRPNWDQLLGEAARHTRSDGVIGIFFCGPLKMGEAVRSSSKKVEMWSNLRDAYLRSVSVGTLMQDMGLSDVAEVLRLRDFGCRVRLVFHEENFS